MSARRVLIFVALLCTGRAVAAQSRVLIADLTASPPAIVSAPASHCEVPQTLAQACRGEDGHTAQELQDVLQCLKRDSSLRWASRRDAQLAVYVLYRGEKPRIQFSEVSRKTRIATDVATLMKLAKGIAGPTPEAARRTPSLSCSSEGYELERDRANLTITIEQTPKTDGGVPAGESSGDVTALEGGTTRRNEQDAQDDPAPARAQATLVTGPAEHWFLSADLPFRRFQELKLNSETNVVEAAEKPTRFFVGLNYSLGDLLSERPAGWRQSIVFKGSVLAGKHPLDSFGFAVAYRGGILSSFGIKFDTVSPFAGVYWTRNDVTPTTEAPGTKTALKSTIQVGFAFNLAEALAWTKGDK